MRNHTDVATRAAEDERALTAAAAIARQLPLYLTPNSDGAPDIYAAIAELAMTLSGREIQQADIELQRCDADRCSRVAASCGVARTERRGPEPAHAGDRRGVLPGPRDGRAPPALPARRRRRRK